MQNLLRPPLGLSSGTVVSRVSGVVLVWTLSLFILTWISGCVDPCKKVECQNGGNCVEGECECTSVFEGRYCEVVSISRFLGNYKTSYEGCFNAAPGQMVSVDKATTGGFSIQFIGLGDYQCPGVNEIRINANVNEQGIVVPEQIVCAGSGFDGYTFKGSGTKTGDTIRLSFTATYFADGSQRKDECIATMIEE